MAMTRMTAVGRAAATTMAVSLLNSVILPGVVHVVVYCVLCLLTSHVLVAADMTTTNNEDGDKDGDGNDGGGDDEDDGDDSGTAATIVAAQW